MGLKPRLSKASANIGTFFYSTKYSGRKSLIHNDFLQFQPYFMLKKAKFRTFISMYRSKEITLHLFVLPI